MSIFYLTLLAVIFSGLGARDQVTVASLSARQGQRPAVLLTGCVLAAVTAAFAGWAAGVVAPELRGAERGILAALAIFFAGGESILITPKGARREPTHSLIALTMVLALHQLSDAARFVIFGNAVGANSPLLAAAGGAVGGMASIAIGWAWPELVLDARLRVARRVIGVIFVLVAIYVAMAALGRTV